MDKVRADIRLIPIRLWWQLSIFLAISIASVSVGFKLNNEMSQCQPESRTFPSIFNSKSSGYSGLYEIAKRAGLSIRPWQLPYRKLVHCQGTLVILEPDQALLDSEMERLLSFVANGNSLIFLDDFQDSDKQSFLRQLNISAQTESPRVSELIQIGKVEPIFFHVPTLCVRSHSHLHGGTSILSDSKGILLTKIKYKNGWIYLGTTPGLCANENLSKPNRWPNFQFLVNLLSTARGDIMFDENCHSYNQSTNAFLYLAKGPAGLFFLQVLIILTLMIISTAQRFGFPAKILPKRKFSNLEFINGLANTFRRAKASDLVWEIINHEFRCRLCYALAISTRQSEDCLANAWSSATGHSADKLYSFLQQSNSGLDKRHLSQQELIALVTACDKISELSKELFRRRKGHSY